MRHKKDNALREVRRKIEEGLESARRGELLDGEAVMHEMRELSTKRRAAVRAGK
jgi:predicted transcriptional regulator